LLGLVSNMPHIHVRVATRPGEEEVLASEAAAKGFDRVIVAGGDGTINKVVNGIGDSGLSVGVIPLGTGNVLANALGIPTDDIIRALEIIGANKVRAVDLARARMHPLKEGAVEGPREDTRLFVLMAGFGFDAAVVEQVSSKVKNVFGTIAHFACGRRAVGQIQPTRFRLALDEGVTYESKAYAVIVANCGTYAHKFKIAPKAVFDDGLLDIIVFEAGSGGAWQLIGRCLSLVFRTTVAGHAATYLKTARVRVDSDPPVKVQVDGDVVGTTSVDIEVLPRSLRLIVP
ncbi:MAG: diacylglycerol/lipid kinase family protein, partial [Armatimonadota bacterium]